MMNTIGVTGAGGYVGNVLIRRLLDQGFRVRGMDNFHKGQCDALLSLINNPSFEFQYGDVTVQDDCGKFVSGLDGIVHLAGIVGFPACKRQPALSYAVNVEGTRNMLEARERYAPYVPFVFASTGSIYGKVEGVCTEESPANFQSIYGEHKYVAEQLVTQAENTVSLRFATGFGVSPCMRVNLLVNDLVYQALTNRCLTIFEADARRTFIHVRDMALAFQRSLWGIYSNSLNHKVYNAGANNLNWTKRELSEFIKLKTGCIVNYADFAKDLDARDYEVDYSRFENDVTLCGITMEQGINELVKATVLIKVRHQYE